MDFHQANLLLHFFLFNSCLRFNPSLTFLAVIFNRSFSFSKHAFLMKAKLFPRSRPYLVSLLPYGASLRSHSLFCTKLFFCPFVTHTSPGWFPVFSVANINKLEHFAERLFAPSPAASRPPLSHLFSLKRLYLTY